MCGLLSHDNLNSSSLSFCPNKPCYNLHFWITFAPRRVYFSVSPSQPVHNNGSSGYGSLGSNGSHEHYISVASSSDSNGNLWEDSHREPVRQRSTNAVSRVDGKINRRYVVCVCADDPTADLCWREQSEELGPAGLSGVKSQNLFSGKTCKR